MFPNFHVAIDLDLYPENDSIRTIGSIFPDINQFSNLTEKTTHHCGRKLKRHFKKYNPKYIPFAIAVKVHNKIDHLAEKSYNGCEVGFVKQGWEALIKFFGPKIHILPEVGIDSFISQKYPELSEIVLASIEEVDVNELASLLGKFKKFRKKEPEITEIVPRYLDRIVLYEKNMNLWGKDLGFIYANYQPDKTKKFYSDALRIVKKKHFKELHKAYTHGKPIVKRAVKYPVLSD